MGALDGYIDISQLGPRSAIAGSDIIHIRGIDTIDSKMTISNLFDGIPVAVKLDNTLSITNIATFSGTKIDLLKPVTINGGIGVTSTGLLLIRQNGDTQANGLTITSSGAASTRIWKDANATLGITNSSNTAGLYINPNTGRVWVNGTDNTVDLLQVGSNTDISASIGRLKMGFLSGNVDDIYIGHYDKFNTTDYNFNIIRSGYTIVNAPSGGGWVSIRNANIPIADFKSTSIDLLKDTTLSGATLHIANEVGIRSTGEIVINRTDATNILRIGGELAADKIHLYSGSILTLALLESGRSIFGGGIDNGTDLLQVNGSADFAGIANFASTGITFSKSILNEMTVNKAGTATIKLRSDFASVTNVNTGAYSFLNAANSTIADIIGQTGTGDAGRLLFRVNTGALLFTALTIAETGDLTVTKAGTATINLRSDFASEANTNTGSYAFMNTVNSTIADILGQTGTGNAGRLLLRVNTGAGLLTALTIAETGGVSFTKHVKFTETPTETTTATITTDSSTVIIPHGAYYVKAVIVSMSGVCTLTLEKYIGGGWQIIDVNTFTLAGSTLLGGFESATGLATGSGAVRMRLNISNGTASANAVLSQT